MLGYAAAVLAALVNALASLLQRAAARREPQQLQLHASLIGRLVRQPLWLLGIASATVSFLLQAFALGQGALSLIEPILALELPITILLSTSILHRHLGKGEVVALAGMTTGLALLLLFLAPRGGHPRTVAATTWATALVASAVLIGLLVAAGRRLFAAERRGAIWGAATGVGFGVTAALMKVMSTEAQTGIVHALTAWQTYLMVAAGIVSLFLAQNAVNAGSLVAAQPGFSVADPITSIVWGTVVFGESVHTGWQLVPASAAIVLLTGSAIVLARSLPSSMGEERESRAASLSPPA